MQTRKPRIEWLDALRGWAVAAVICVHSGQAAHLQGFASRLASAGQYGVQLFFVVSALTIGLTYESHIRKSGRSLASQLGWLLKRFFRIAPLYYLAAIFYPIERYAIYLRSGGRYGLTTQMSDIFLNVAFLHTWIHSANNSVVPGGWSIGVEMFFYILVPVIWAVRSPRLRRYFLFYGSVTGIVVTCLAARVTTGSWRVENDSFLYYWFPTQAPVLLLSLIFYLTAPGLWRPERESKRAISFMGFLAFMVLALSFGTVGEISPILAPTAVALAFMCLITSLHGRILRLFSNPFAVALGRISYSVYIFHFLVLDCERGLLQRGMLDRLGPFAFPMVFAITTVTTSGMALIGKRFIEDPGIRLGHALSDLLIGPRRNHAAPANS